MTKIPRFSSYLVLALVFGLSVTATSQIIPENQYGLKVVQTMEQYHQLVKKDSNNALVDLTSLIPDLVLEIKYATGNNFTGMQLYPYPRVYLRLPAARALAKVQKELKKQGLGLKIYDAYRPYSVTAAMWEFVKDENYAADPRKGSRHNRGCAIDLTIIDLKTGTEIEMPTPYDDFTDKAHHSYKDLSPKAIENRSLLLGLMKGNSFTPIESEWWHYDYEGWLAFYLLDINFTELESDK